MMKDKTIGDTIEICGHVFQVISIIDDEFIYKEKKHFTLFQNIFSI